MEENSGRGVGQTGRIQIIDALRGVSILLMVAYHAGLDLYLVKLLPKELIFHPVLEALQVFFACLFVFLSGISCRFSKNNLKRGLIFLAFAAGISLVTYFYNPSLYVRFGVLHLLGVAAIVFALVGKRLDALLPSFSAPVVYILLFAATWPIRYLDAKVSFLWPFGIVKKDFASADYFPIFPFLFVYLLGTWAGKYIAAGRFPKWFYAFKCPFFAAVGRATLWIYLLHQPVIIGILYLAGLMPK